MYLRTFITVAAAALAALPKSDAVFERQQLGSNLRLRKEPADAAPGFIEPSCDVMKEIIKSQKDEIASLKAMVHKMKDELADERRRLEHIDIDGWKLPCLPSAMPSSVPSASPSSEPSASPSESPSNEPSQAPSSEPSASPSESPSNEPSQAPSSEPSASPSESPSNEPSAAPSSEPSASPSESPSNEPSASPSRTFDEGQAPVCNAGRLLWQQRSLQSEACFCGECNGLECKYETGTGKKGEAFCIKPTNDDCTGDLEVAFKPGGGSCKGTFKFNNDDLCEDGWLLSRDKLVDASVCNGGNKAITNLDITSACGGAASIHASCSDKIELCDTFGNYQIFGVRLVGGEDLLFTFNKQCPAS